MSFQVNQQVQWSSHGGRASKDKTGTVVAVVEPGANVHAVIVALGLNQTHDLTCMHDSGKARGHETYLVSVPQGPKCKPMLYRPLVSKLRAAGTAQPQAQASSPKAQPKQRPVTQTVVASLNKPSESKPAGLVNHIGIALDTSCSMSALIGAATGAVRQHVQTIQEQARQTGQETTITLMTFDDPGMHRIRVDASPAASFPNVPSFDARGGSTALYDAAGTLIERLQSRRDAESKNVSFLLFVITDGEENSSSRFSAHSLRSLIQKVQSTDRWTLAFLVPPDPTHRYKRELVQRLGIPEGNIQEWSQTEAGVRQAAVANVVGTQAYFADRAQGKKSTQKFYVDLSKVSQKDIEKKLVDVSSHFKSWEVPKAGLKIADFVSEKTKRPYIAGSALQPTRTCLSVTGRSK